MDHNSPISFSISQACNYKKIKSKENGDCCVLTALKVAGTFLYAVLFCGYTVSKLADVQKIIVLAYKHPNEAFAKSIQDRLTTTVPTERRLQHHEADAGTLFPDVDSESEESIASKTERIVEKLHTLVQGITDEEIQLVLSFIPSESGGTLYSPLPATDISLAGLLGGSDVHGVINRCTIMLDIYANRFATMDDSHVEQFSTLLGKTKNSNPAFVAWLSNLATVAGNLASAVDPSVGHQQSEAVLESMRVHIQTKLRTLIPGISDEAVQQVMRFVPSLLGGQMQISMADITAMLQLLLGEAGNASSTRHGLVVFAGILRQYSALLNALDQTQIRLLMPLLPIMFLQVMSVLNETSDADSRTSG